MNYRFIALCFAATLLLLPSVGETLPRKRVSFDRDWEFAFGNAADPARNFGCGTEYFNYLTKVNSIHNEEPYSPSFDPSRWGVAWTGVTLPHDWVVDLPYDSLASHSHGYKTVGYRYPLTSVGWYRKTFALPEADSCSRVALEFDGIFRDSRVWVNGFYLGGEPSGYASHQNDITEYLNRSSENVVAVRADASLEEGWFYEGAGIYRHTWHLFTDALHVDRYGVKVLPEVSPDLGHAGMEVVTSVVNDRLSPASFAVRHTLRSPAGIVVASVITDPVSLQAKDRASVASHLIVDHPDLWHPDSAKLYRLVTEVIDGQMVTDSVTTVTGLRHICFDADSGLIVNSRRLALLGVNMHQDHAGVGSAIPDALNLWRLRQLKALGVNAYRSSHNPMSPNVLDMCDSLGILVSEENRLPGINDEHRRLLSNMIERDINHPSVMLWSIGNEEWGIEWNPRAEGIVASMREFCHRIDHNRPITVATSSGPDIVIQADVADYNYILQNPVDRHRRDYPERCALGSEETSGCGTRGVYFDDRARGHMAAINRSHNGPDSMQNAIERGMRFYNERPWLAGLFYWTGFDYRGEPNPLKFPATGSQFGILDYCGFPKDEAFYLKSCWTDAPVVYILPHWTLRGHEGDSIEVWVYSNCEQVSLCVNGRDEGVCDMPRNGHLSWKTIYEPGQVEAVGFRNGQAVAACSVATAGAPADLHLKSDRNTIAADGRDVAVMTVKVVDHIGHPVPDACIRFDISVDGSALILGVGNGAPAWQACERPAPPSECRHFNMDTFNGMAQILIQSDNTAGDIAVTIEANPSLKSCCNISSK